MREGSGPGKILESSVVSTMTEMMETTIKSGTGKKPELIVLLLEKLGLVNH